MEEENSGDSTELPIWFPKYLQMKVCIFSSYAILLPSNKSRFNQKLFSLEILFYAKWDIFLKSREFMKLQKSKE